MFPKDKRPALPLPLQTTISSFSQVVLLATAAVTRTANAVNEVKYSLMVVREIKSQEIYDSNWRSRLTRSVIANRVYFCSWSWVDIQLV